MSAGAWWPETIVGLGAQMLRLPLLPFRLLGLGLEAMSAMPAMPAMPPISPGPGAVGDGRWIAEPAPGAGGWSAPPAPASGGWWLTEPAVSAGPPEGEIFAGCAAGGGTAAGFSDQQAKEDKEMTCCCDQSLGGCELKIVWYTIVTVDPEFDDDDRRNDGGRIDAGRIVIPGQTISTSSDMTPADFTAYVIASQRGENRARLDRYDPEYLRVCFKVLCRYPLPCVDYEKEQAQALRAINRTLREKEGERHLAPSSSRELATTEPKRGSR
jgi:hypothetical protein